MIWLSATAPLLQGHPWELPGQHYLLSHVHRIFFRSWPVHGTVPFPPPFRMVKQAWTCSPFCALSTSSRHGPQDNSSLSATSLTAWDNQTPRLGFRTGLWMQSNGHVKWQTGKPLQGWGHISHGALLPHVHYGEVPCYLKSTRQALDRVLSGSTALMWQPTWFTEWVLGLVLQDAAWFAMPPGSSFNVCGPGCFPWG